MITSSRKPYLTAQELDRLVRRLKHERGATFVHAGALAECLLLTIPGVEPIGDGRRVLAELLDNVVR